MLPNSGAVGEVGLSLLSLLFSAYLFPKSPLNYYESLGLLTFSCSGVYSLALGANFENAPKIGLPASSLSSSLAGVYSFGGAEGTLPNIDYDAVLPFLAPKSIDLPKRDGLLVSLPDMPHPKAEPDVLFPKMPPLASPKIEPFSFSDVFPNIEDYDYFEKSG